MTIWFDMDGTLADLYAVDNWLNKLMAFDPSPYAEAEVLLNFSQLARLLHKVQNAGYEIGIISWLSRTSNTDYDMAVTQAKMTWLNEHLPSVTWDEIKIVSYGTNKLIETGGGILFDDEERNRNDWGEGAYEPSAIVEILKGLVE